VSKRIAIVAAIGLALAVTATLPAQADFEDGNAAYAKRDYETAFNAWLPLAEAGDPKAQNNIGFMFRKGRGTQINEGTAIYWYSRSAAQGFAEAMTNLGYMYDEGRTVEQDLVVSYMWFSLAADRGRQGAAGHLEVLETYLTPEEVAEAKRRAADWVEKPEAGAAAE
jgi:uncharacterized protein